MAYNPDPSLQRGATGTGSIRGDFLWRLDSAAAASKSGWQPCSRLPQRESPKSAVDAATIILSAESGVGAVSRAVGGGPI
jgi:hypothetical protein